MDHFGIGTAVKGAAGVYFQAARRSGRTLSLVNSVKDGDRIVFTEQNEADRVRRMCRDRGVEVTCVVCTAMARERLFERGPVEGRTIFDHSWVEQFYLHRLEDAEKEVEFLEKRFSGSERPQETEQSKFERVKWRGVF